MGANIDNFTYLNKLVLKNFRCWSTKAVTEVNSSLNLLWQENSMKIFYNWTPFWCPTLHRKTVWSELSKLEKILWKPDRILMSHTPLGDCAKWTHQIGENNQFQRQYISQNPNHHYNIWGNHNTTLHSLVLKCTKWNSRVCEHNQNAKQSFVRVLDNITDVFLKRTTILEQIINDAQTIYWRTEDVNGVKHFWGLNHIHREIVQRRWVITRTQIHVVPKIAGRLWKSVWKQRPLWLLLLLLSSFSSVSRRILITCNLQQLES